MTNLLPPIAKKQIVFEYWVRVVSAWVILWSFCLLISAFVLWPTYILIVDSGTAYADSVADASERTAKYEQISLSLSQATQQAQTIIINERQIKLSTISTDIKQAVSQEIVLTGMRIDRDGTGIQPVQVQGVAQDRQSLAQFKDRLETIEYVASVNLPIENLASSQDIEFSISAIINNDSL